MDDRFEDPTPGARILAFPGPKITGQRASAAAAVDKEGMVEDLGAAASNMVAIQAAVVNMLLHQARQLQHYLPRIVDGLTRPTESDLIARHWISAIDAQDNFLANIMHVLDNATLLAVSPDLHASTERSVTRLRSLIAECRRPAEERAVLFGSAAHLRRCVSQEMEVLDRNLAAFDAAAREAGGLDPS